MKREKFLWPLTQSHHRALLAARRIRVALSSAGVNGKDVAAETLAKEVRLLWESELKGHFQYEEAILDLYEVHVGKDDLESLRIRADHRTLETLALLGKEADIRSFVEVLPVHIRFEEDVLFGKIEKVLGEGDKRTIGGILAANNKQ